MKDDRSPIAVGYTWSVIITTIGMEMALPPLLGVWADHKCGTLILFTILGAVLGMVIGLMHVLRIAKHHEKSENDFHDDQ